MILVRCKNMHYFDPEKNKLCPYCGEEPLFTKPDTSEEVDHDTFNKQDHDPAGEKRVFETRCVFCMRDKEGDACQHCGRLTSSYVPSIYVLPPGTMVHGRYLIGAVIGEGGFGITYIGYDTLFQVRVAVKEFYPAGMASRSNTVSNDVIGSNTENARKLFKKSREKFLYEARLLAKYSNEQGIVSVKDYFEENQTVYIIMEYLDGITLKQLIEQKGKIPYKTTINFMLPVMRSLRILHNDKLIHRDISPDNIMVVGNSVKLIDFGATREFADENSKSVILKPGYAPIEQYSRTGEQGAWTDVYALCATMYQCITGKVPPESLERLSSGTQIIRPTNLGIQISHEFEEILLQGLALKREDRLQRMDQLIQVCQAEIRIKSPTAQKNQVSKPTDPRLLDAVSEKAKSDGKGGSDDGKHNSPFSKFKKSSGFLYVVCIAIALTLSRTEFYNGGSSGTDDFSTKNHKVTETNTVHTTTTTTEEKQDTPPSDFKADQWWLKSDNSLNTILVGDSIEVGLCNDEKYYTIPDSALWGCTNTNIFTVKNGTIYGMNVGTASVKLQIYDVDYTLPIRVIKIPTESDSIFSADTTSLEMSCTDNKTVTFHFNLALGDDWTALYYFSSNIKDQISVEEGNVYGDDATSMTSLNLTTKNSIPCKGKCTVLVYKTNTEEIIAAKQIDVTITK